MDGVVAPVLWTFTNILLLLAVVLLWGIHDRLGPAPRPAGDAADGDPLCCPHCGAEVDETMSARCRVCQQSVIPF